MRSRPTLSVYLSSERPNAGERLQARVVLTSLTETPYEQIEVSLAGKESRYEDTTQAGKVTTSHYHQRDIVALVARFDAGVLAPGTWERTVTFDLPRDAPPSYKSKLASITYALEVRVYIPWWPDRRERYTVTVEAPSGDPGPARAQLFTTQAGDHRGADPVLELSLEDKHLPIGRSLSGAVAITGLGQKRLRRVELACVVVETALVKSSLGPTETDRRTWTVHKGSPEAGASLPFTLAIPADLPTTFQSPYIRVDHFIEVRAVVALGADITLRVPVHASRSAASGRLPDAPLVGSARHANVWQSALQQVQRMALPGLPELRFDAARGVASFTCDGVVVELAEEQGEVRKRGDRRRLLASGGLGESGPCLTAELSWPDLGLDLRVAERRWVDFGQEHAGLDAKLQKRCTVRCREATQAASLLTPALCHALLTFDEVGLDDRCAVVLRRGGVYTEDALVRFVAEAHQLAMQVAVAAGGLAPPPALAEHVTAWRAFAQTRAARLRRGDFALLDWSLRGVPLTFTHRWEGAQVVGSELRTSLPAGSDANVWRDTLGLAVRSAGFAEREQVGVALPTLLQPDTLLPVADAFTLAVLGLLGREAGPYR